MKKESSSVYVFVASSFDKFLSNSERNYGSLIIDAKDFSTGFSFKTSASLAMGTVLYT
jgi:hypothetical protein